VDEGPTTFDSVVRSVARLGTVVPPLTVGQILDETYELTDRIGGGGMGIVFRARDRKLGRDVAIKTLKAGDGGEELRRLFEREARATAQLLHPNIVTLYHVGVHEHHPYLVLELLSGESLAARLARKRRLPVSDALALLDSVLAAISFAHERGVIHRDLKPSNVFITVDDRVKVLDFGVALALDTDPGPVTRGAGTPGYMAPEQRDGAPPDVRTDVWAAALLLLECLTGRRVDETSITAALRDVEAPAAVRALLGRALARDKNKRPSTANQLRDELATAANAASPTRHRRLPLVMGMLCAALLTAAVTFELAHDEPAAIIPVTPITASELNARGWHVNYGEMRLHVENDGTFYGVYGEKDGILEGTYANDRFVGWWCQGPTHTGPDEAGKVELHFVRGDKRVLIEGNWMYGDGRAAAWQSNFYGVSLETPPDYRLEQRMQHHATCPVPVH